MSELPRFSIKMLGGLSVTCTVDNVTRVMVDRERSPKRGWVLLEYLLTNRKREITRAELAYALWPAGDIGDAQNTLKTLVHRVRASLEELGVGRGADVLVFRNGLYGWNNDVETDIDVERFVALCDKADACEDEDVRTELLTQAVGTYEGDFLARTPGELWAADLTAELHGRFVECCHTLSAIMLARGKHAELSRLMEHAVEIEPYDEALHSALVLSLNAQGERAEALRRYNDATALFLDRLGVAPSEEFRALYRELASSSYDPEPSLNVVRDMITESDAADKAFYCEFEMFRELVQVYARNAARSGLAMQLAMLTALDAEGGSIAPKRLPAVMRKLSDVISGTLRIGDAYSRYSSCQYVILLVSATCEDAEAVSKRVVRAYKRAYPKAPVTFKVDRLPVLPARM